MELREAFRRLLLRRRNVDPEFGEAGPPTGSANASIIAPLILTMISFGVPFGAKTEPSRHIGRNADSSVVGIPGIAGERCGERFAMLSRPGPNLRQGDGRLRDLQFTLPATRSDLPGRRPGRE